MQQQQTMGNSFLFIIICLLSASSHCAFQITPTRRNALTSSSSGRRALVPHDAPTTSNHMKCLLKSSAMLTAIQQTTKDHGCDIDVEFPTTIGCKSKIAYTTFFSIIRRRVISIGRRFVGQPTISSFVLSLSIFLLPFFVLSGFPGSASAVQSGGRMGGSFGGGSSRRQMSSRSYSSPSKSRRSYSSPSRNSKSYSSPPSRSSSQLNNSGPSRSRTQLDRAPIRTNSSPSSSNSRSSQSYSSPSRSSSQVDSAPSRSSGDGYSRSPSSSSRTHSPPSRSSSQLDSSPSRSSGDGYSRGYSRGYSSGYPRMGYPRMGYGRQLYSPSLMNLLSLKRQLHSPSSSFYANPHGAAVVARPNPFVRIFKMAAFLYVANFVLAIIMHL